MSDIRNGVRMMKAVATVGFLTDWHYTPELAAQLAAIIKGLSESMCLVLLARVEDTPSDDAKVATLKALQSRGLLDGARYATMLGAEVASALILARSVADELAMVSEAQAQEVHVAQSAAAVERLAAQLVFPYPDELIHLMAVAYQASQASALEILAIYADGAPTVADAVEIFDARVTEREREAQERRDLVDVEILAADREAAQLAQRNEAVYDMLSWDGFPAGPQGGPYGEVPMGGNSPTSF